MQASSRGGYGEISQLEVWTEPGTPEIPPRPNVLSTTTTTISVQLQNVGVTRGPISGYFVVVERVVAGAAETKKRRKKRALPDPVTFIPLSGGYTAAEIAPEYLLTSSILEIGDGQLWGTYRNSVLEPQQLYNIYFVVASAVDQVTKMSFSQLVSPVRTIDSDTIVTPTLTLPPRTTTTVSTFSSTESTSTVTKPPTTTSSTTTTTATEEPTTSGVIGKEDDNTLVIVLCTVIPLVVIIIVLIILLVYCLVLRKKNTKDYEVDNNTAWMNFYSKNYGVPVPRKKSDRWSDVHDLNDSKRHPIIDTNYHFEDLKVGDMHHATPAISFEEEYKKLPQGQCYAWNAALEPQNITERNRFDQFLAYDHSRVVLRDKEDSDYINANFIQGYKKKDAYIAGSSPFNDITVADFWYMIYQYNIEQVVFLGRLMEDTIVKSVKYWPTNNETIQHGEININHVQTENFANFTVREFNIQRGNGDIKHVVQYQYKAWPDHGVPDDPIPLLEFRHKVGKESFRDDGPVLLHCGTGVSRVAVYIAVDSLLQQAKYENVVNVFKFCRSMRKSRINMVRTLKQYKFIYDCLFEELLTKYNIVGEDLKTSYRQLSRISRVTDKSYFREQFEILEEYSPKLDPDLCKVALREGNVKKNRFPSIVPPDNYRPVLKTHTAGQQVRSDYVNALFLDSYTAKNKFVMTQTPLLDTVNDFWKLVYDYDIHTLVMLNDSDFKEETCVKYWPSRASQQNFDPLIVTLLGEEEGEHVTIRTMKLQNPLEPEYQARKIKMFQFESWRMYEKVGQN